MMHSEESNPLMKILNIALGSIGLIIFFLMPIIGGVLIVGITQELYEKEQKYNKSSLIPLYIMLFIFQIFILIVVFGEIFGY